MLRFFVIFSVLLVGLFTLEILQPAEKYVILPFTSFIADVSAWIIQVFDDNKRPIGFFFENVYGTNTDTLTARFYSGAFFLIN